MAKLGRPTKDGVSFNCKLSSKISEELEFISKLEGKTKTSIVEDAIAEYLNPYRNSKGNISFVPAYLLSGASELERRVAEIEGREVEITKEKCFIIEETSMFGAPYYKIYNPEIKNIMKVPASDIEFIEQVGGNK